MKDPAQLELVIKALTCGVTGCVDWHPKQMERVRGDRFLKGLSPEEIQAMLIEYITNGGGKVQQVTEKGRGYDHRDYYYKVVVPCPDLFKKGLFVELELLDKDPDVPVVFLVNAHEQR